MNLHDFYLDNQDELESLWENEVQNKYMDSGDFDHNNDDNFWEFVADERDKAIAAAEGYL